VSEATSSSESNAREVVFMVIIVRVIGSFRGSMRTLARIIVVSRHEVQVSYGVIGQSASDV
jgi:hypothetical protein